MPPGSDSFHGYVQKEVDYLQLDYIANPYLTVTVGRYLTPFGIFNERLYPIFIRDLQSDPLILPIATGPSGAGTGAMLRGGFPLRRKINLNQAAYFSALSTLSPVDSNRAADGRVGSSFRVLDSKSELPSSVSCKTNTRTPSAFTSLGSPRLFRSTLAANTRDRIRAAVTGLNPLIASAKSPRLSISFEESSLSRACSSISWERIPVQTGVPVETGTCFLPIRRSSSLVSIITSATICER
jgi:hypothetical protein